MSHARVVISMRKNNRGNHPFYPFERSGERIKEGVHEKSEQPFALFNTHVASLGAPSWTCRAVDSEIRFLWEHEKGGPALTPSCYGLAQHGETWQPSSSNCGFGKVWPQPPGACPSNTDRPGNPRCRIFVEVDERWRIEAD